MTPRRSRCAATVACAARTALERRWNDAETGERPRPARPPGSSPVISARAKGVSTVPVPPMVPGVQDPHGPDRLDHLLGAHRYLAAPVQPGASRRQNSEYPARSVRTGQVRPSRPSRRSRTWGSSPLGAFRLAHGGPYRFGGDGNVGRVGESAKAEAAKVGAGSATNEICSKTVIAAFLAAARSPRLLRSGEMLATPTS